MTEENSPSEDSVYDERRPSVRIPLDITRGRTFSYADLYEERIEELGYAIREEIPLTDEPSEPYFPQFMQNIFKKLEKYGSNTQEIGRKRPRESEDLNFYDLNDPFIENEPVEMLEDENEECRKADQEGFYVVDCSKVQIYRPTAPRKVAKLPRKPSEKYQYVKDHSVVIQSFPEDLRKLMNELEEIYSNKQTGNSRQAHKIYESVAAVLLSHPDVSIQAVTESLRNITNSKLEFIRKQINKNISGLHKRKAKKAYEDATKLIKHKLKCQLKGSKDNTQQTQLWSPDFELEFTNALDVVRKYVDAHNQFTQNYSTKSKVLEFSELEMSLKNTLQKMIDGSRDNNKNI